VHPFLKTGWTLAVFQQQGRVLSLKEVSKICARGTDKALAHFLRKTLGMLSGPMLVIVGTRSAEVYTNRGLLFSLCYDLMRRQ